MTVAPEEATAMAGFDDAGDEAIRQRILEMEAELVRLKTQLEESGQARKILTVTGPELKTETVRFFTESLGSPAQVAADIGDFWLVAEAVGEAWCFGEIFESELGNVTREHVAQVMLDRGKAGKPDDFPALLVINTYYGQASVAERDQPVPEDVRRRSAEDTILVVRTLDLLRLRQKELSGFAGIKEFLEAARAGGGWYEVNSALSSKVHTS